MNHDPSSRYTRLHASGEDRTLTSKSAESRSIDWAGTHDIHTDLAILQVRRPSAGEGTHCRFGRRVNAECRTTFDRNLGRIKHDCATVGNQRQSLLDGKENALYIRIEGLIVVFLSNRSKGSEGDLKRSLDPGDLARYVSALLNGLGVQAANGASRKQMSHIVDLAISSLPI